ncbi:RagB/SusD family nutrient uptake outer membrane protein [Bacteroides thetaiotaomicron]|uniref:RagB/SusD family nutrient uptake outer membrane protein n=1 Tax=Bacteroides thetaiotaomicron TaxID=818 RepID=UPI001C37E036|nr:RagB/SusD family nutrient uptake outer membrane protein [Bacteroides thetaiotaomicron]MBV4338135.1 RagB/SusD family nutrient uptake outer membrane protein [Bacteroides thetaiotaomicron]MBV4374583.1 RagB/SusD family nutrient uptake outer membrane protein [Bacteroides thetaiotaomicron]MBV4379934.1 RagB/SusD family nutrient uptake outer membrane protein [Bacteroides thetaiotaomicron]MCB6320771.1 RagB/SusD family nutrient uptake outer membrane protein [Bacteroides thetaiotaomicron]MCB7239411.1 
MKKLVYYILLSISALSFSACTDYINVDKYFYDQVSLDSAFSKRIYVDGWLSSAYSVMNKLGEYKEPFRWASDDLYHPDMKEYVEGSYSADKPKGDENAGESRLWKYYEGIRKASTFLDNVDRCLELTMDEIADMKGQARFLRAYCYWALIRVFGPVPLIPLEGLDADLSYEELSLPRTHFDEIVSFIDTELAETARLLPMRRTVNNLGRPTRGAALGLRARVLLYAASPLYNGNLDFFNVVDNKGNQLISQTYDESKWAKAAAAAKDVIELAKTSGLYELYTIAPKIGTLDMYRPPVHPEYSTKDYPDGWANIDPLLSYKSNFDGSVQGSKNPELIFTRTSDGTGTINDWMYQALPRTISGNNRLCVTQKQVNAYAMNDGRTISEAANTGDYVTTGFTTEAYSENNPFLPAKVSLMYNKREPRFYASIAYNGSVWEAASASEPRYRNQQIFYYRGTEDGKQGFKEECPLTGMTLKKFYNSEDSRTDGGYVIEKTEMTIRYAEILLIYAEALNELSEGEVYHLKTYSNEDVEIKRDEDEMRYAIKRIRMRAGVPDYTNETYKNQADFRVKLKRERQVELLGENSMRYFDLRRWKDALTEENQLLQGCNINISDDDTYIADFYKETPVSSVHKVFEQRMYLFPFPTYELKRNVNLTQNPGW